MSEKYKAYDPHGIYFVTLTVVDWVDLFTRESYKSILLQSLKYCIENKNLNLHAFVFMTNHIHLIISTKEDNNTISSIIRDFKKHTNKECIKVIQEVTESRSVWLLAKFKYAAQRVRRIEGYKIWQDGYHPIQLLNNKMIDKYINYVHQNPVKTGNVVEDWHHKYSSAGIYADNSDLDIKLMLI